MDIWKKTILIEASNYMSSFKLLLFGICCGINKLKNESVERIELYHPTLEGKATMINNIEDNKLIQVLLTEADGSTPNLNHSSFTYFTKLSTTSTNKLSMVLICS